MEVDSPCLQRKLVFLLGERVCQTHSRDIETHSRDIETHSS